MPAAGPSTFGNGVDVWLKPGHHCAGGQSVRARRAAVTGNDRHHVPGEADVECRLVIHAERRPDAGQEDVF